MQVKPLLSSIQSATFLQDYLKAHGINHVEKFLYPQKTDFDDPFDYPHMMMVFNALINILLIIIQLAY